jgi:hypothetical protein
MSDVVTPPIEQELVRELAYAVVAHTAPDELVLFEETSEEFFDDPDGVLRARGRDEAVGFGLDVAMLTPYILAAAGSVVTFLLTTVADSVKDEVRPRITARVRGLFRGNAAASPDAEPARLTPAQARQVHDITRQRATSLGLPESTAVLLADAVVGGMAVSG